jgi:hypothetical protein
MVSVFERKVSEQSADSSVVRARHIFHKTKMCNFFLSGRCKKKSRCSFAHCESELQAQPELRCTKLCPKVLEGGQCTDTDCKFAHKEDEVRVLVRLTSDSVSDLDDLESLDVPQDSFARQMTEDPAQAVACRARIKNTFITICEEDDEDVARPGRSRSAPPILREPWLADGAMSGEDTSGTSDGPAPVMYNSVESSEEDEYTPYFTRQLRVRQEVGLKEDSSMQRPTCWPVSPSVASSSSPKASWCVSGG